MQVRRKKLFPGTIMDKIFETKLSKVVNINIEIKNVDSMLFQVTNLDVDIHNVVAKLI